MKYAIKHSGGLWVVAVGRFGYELGYNSPQLFNTLEEAEQWLSMVGGKVVIYE